MADNTQPILLFFALCVYRVANGLFVVTYFNPDEYWQSLEIAHSMVFDNGHRTWEWQQSAQIRSFVHPGIFAVFFKILQLMGLDTRWWIAFGPRVLQGIFAAICDYYVYRTSALLFGPKSAKYALLVQVLSWFNAYCLVRTFSNSMEATLTAVAFFYWVKARVDSTSTKICDRRMWWLVGTAVMIRPTAAIIWMPFAGQHILHLYSKSESPNKIKRILGYVFEQVFPAASVLLLASLLLDRLCYGNWTFPPFVTVKNSCFNFIRINLLHGVGRIYGVHHPLYYLYEGLPVVLGCWLPWAVHALYTGTTGLLRNIVISIGFAVFILSLSPHKEYRFLLPLLPLLFPLVGQSLSQFIQRTTRPRLDIFFAISPGSMGMECRSLTLGHPSIPGLPGMDGCPRSGPLQTVDIIAERITAYNSETSTAVDFLMGCHAMPFHSHLHLTPAPSLSFLNCSPRIFGLADKNETETKRFESDPVDFVRSRYHCKDAASCRYNCSLEECGPLPRIVVMYSAEAILCKPVLEQLEYTQVEEVFYTHIDGDVHMTRNHSSTILLFESRHGPGQQNN